MYNLTRLSLADMAHATTRLRKLGIAAQTFEEAAQGISKFIFDEFGDGTGHERASVLTRVYKTHKLGGLPRELQTMGKTLHPDATEATRCLVLAASTGQEAAWNSRKGSKGHQVIPLPSPEAVARLPMVAALLSQLGIDVGLMLGGTPELLVDAHEKTFNVFHVAEAAGSPVIPAQRDFVERFGVRSALGCGGLFPDGELYATILFSRVPISRDTADIFRPLALAMKLALLKFAPQPLFGGPEGA